jgi:hypothetical protein
LVRALHVPVNIKGNEVKKQISISQRIRTMIDGGHNNKAIIDKLKCKPQAVYNIRYQVNKERGLGSIGSLPKPTEGIGAPPKRRYVRKENAETGITAPYPKVNPYQFAPMRPTTPMPDMQITIVKPTLWQRVKEWFRG